MRTRDIVRGIVNWIIGIFHIIMVLLILYVACTTHHSCFDATVTMGFDICVCVYFFFFFFIAMLYCEN